MIITIDGLSGTGKSITSQILAEKLGFKFIDSGKFYRTVTLHVIQKQIKFNDYQAICKAARDIKIEFIDNKVLLNNNDISDKLYTLEITNKVNNICKINALRRIINDRLASLVTDEYKGYIFEGKDMGSSAFPKADFKFYLISEMNARIARRYQDFIDNNSRISKEKIEKEIKLRDDFEMKKKPVILKKPENAIVVDATNMIIEEQVNFIYRIIIDPETSINNPLP